MESKKFLSIEQMKDDLEELGNKQVWSAIETIKDPLERIAFRQLFFICGGDLGEK